MTRHLGLALVVIFISIRPLAAQDPSPLARLFAATSDGPYVSFSWGENWESLRRGLPRDIRVFYCIGPSAYAGGAAGLFVSEDFGENWRAVESWESGEITYILTSDYFAADRILFVGTRGGLFRSRDAGEEWERIAEDVIGGSVNAMAWPGPQLFVASSEGLFRTEDEGGTWEELGTGLPQGPLLSLALSSYFAQEPTIFVGSEGAGIYRSRNGGESFEPIGGPDWTRRSVHTVYWWRSVLFAGTDQGLFISQDAGESWESAATELEKRTILTLSIPAPDSPTGSDVIVGTEQGVFKTSDGAISWRHLTDGMKLARVFGFGSFRIPEPDPDGKRKE